MVKNVEFIPSKGTILRLIGVWPFFS